ncbi:unnamed protein product [Macrosiphum euphorbiae]|uniref:BTB domain-containing protein n=1 Tax=Macrosiphum euphorbiae TaxID=13131 RepID=A0AAV0W4U9_9HEMI|nr:unnamed protein product [Macrosiphum euphorbiae]
MSDQNLTHINFCAINRFQSSYNALNTMRRKNEFCDIQFLVGEIKISAHKAILSSHSSYFNDMFNGNFKDSKLLDIKNVEITPSSFELLIDFLYTSQITINYYNVQELLIASRFLMLNDVEKECLKYLEQNIDIGNFMTVKRIADRNEIKDLHELFLSYVLKNYNNVVKSNTFLSFSFELMMELIQSDDLHAEEEEAYESIMMWLKHDLKERLKCLPELFKSIRLSLMSIDYLDDIVQEEELIRSDITSMNYLCNAYKVVHRQEKSSVDVLSSTFNITYRKSSKKLQSYLEKEKSVENDDEDIEEQESSVEIYAGECEDTEDDG